MVVIGIVGTAGRTGSSKPSAALYAQMYDRCVELVEARVSDWSEVHLVSGGAAWSDHLAVLLFLDKNPASLKLYLPCEWISDGQHSRFQDTGSRRVSAERSTDWRTNPGKTANAYHRSFSADTTRRSLYDIECARLLGAELDCTHPGFHARNRALAESVDLLLAFTWGKADQPEDGGTAHTWNHCRKEKIHLSLSNWAASQKPH